MKVYDWWPQWSAYVVTDNGERSLFWTPADWAAALQQECARMELALLSMAEPEGMVN